MNLVGARYAYSKRVAINMRRLHRIECIRNTTTIFCIEYVKFALRFESPDKYYIWNSLFRNAPSESAIARTFRREVCLKEQLKPGTGLQHCKKGDLGICRGRPCRKPFNYLKLDLKCFAKADIAPCFVDAPSWADIQVIPAVVPVYAGPKSRCATAIGQVVRGVGCNMRQSSRRGFCSTY